MELPKRTFNKKDRSKNHLFRFTLRVPAHETWVNKEVHLLRQLLITLELPHRKTCSRLLTAARLFINLSN